MWPVLVVVVARPDAGLSVLDLDDLARDSIQQIAVVANDDRGPAVVGEEFFEPLGGLQVEVIRRLVEQEQVGLEHQNLGQAETRQLASAECGCFCLVQVRLEAEGRQGHLDAGLVLVAARELEIVAQPVVLLHLGVQGRAFEAFHLVRDGVDGLLEPKNILDAGVHLLKDRALAAESRLLGQIPDAKTPTFNHLPHVRLDLSDDQLEDRAFAGAVGSDHADFLGPVEPKVQLVQHDFRAEGPVDIM
ncbi:MAG: hypothetical protein P8Z79_20715 [Sedimentisphaerales bacterium]